MDPMNIKKTAKYAAIITTATALTISSALSQQLIQKKPPQLFIRGKTTSTRKIINSSLRLQGFLKKENNKNIFAIENGVKTHNNDVNIERQKNSYSYYNSGTLNILKESVIDAIIIVGISIGLAELRKATIRYISRWLDKVYSSGKH